MLNCLLFPSLVASYAPSLEILACFNVIIAKFFISDGQKIVTKIMAGTGGLVGMLVDPGGPIATYISPISRTTSILSCNHRRNCAEKHNFCIFDFLEFTTQVIIFYPGSTRKLLVSLLG